MAVPRLAATVLVVCPSVATTAAATSGGTFKLMMIKRHSKARFMANTYVFPGGCVDEKDKEIAAAFGPKFSLPLAEYRAAALRELQEETGCSIGDDGVLSSVKENYGPWNGSGSAASHLVPYQHWITPKQEKYRYDTRFFLHRAQPAAVDLEVKADPKEVEDIRWVSPGEAMRLHDEKDSNFRLPPPTYMIMLHLDTLQSADDLIDTHNSLFGRSVEAMPCVEPVLDLKSKPVGVYMSSGWIHLPDGTHRTGPATVHITKEPLPYYPPFGAEEQTSKL